MIEIVRAEILSQKSHIWLYFDKFFNFIEHIVFKQQKLYFVNFLGFYDIKLKQFSFRFAIKLVSYVDRGTWTLGWHLGVGLLVLFKLIWTISELNSSFLSLKSIWYYQHSVLLSL